MARPARGRQPFRPSVKDGHEMQKPRSQAKQRGRAGLARVRGPGVKGRGPGAGTGGRRKAGGLGVRRAWPEARKGRPRAGGSSGVSWEAARWRLSDDSCIGARVVHNQGKGGGKQRNNDEVTAPASSPGGEERLRAHLLDTPSRQLMYLGIENQSEK